MYYLGIDGGGTKTTALVCDENFDRVAEVVGDSVNYRSEGFAAARQNMSDILREIKKRTGINRFDSVFIGSSALFGRADADELKAFSDGIFNADRIAMDSDLFIALKACRKPNAAVVICGTGSMVAALGDDGKVVTRGGFGYIFGDEGSAHAISKDAMFRAARAAESTEPPTELTEALLSFYGVKDIYEFTDKVYDPPMDRKRIASFAPCVTRCAEHGDVTANEILRSQACLIADTVKSVVKVLAQKPELFLFGGVFENSEPFNKYFREAVKGYCTDCSVLTVPPVMGAVYAAAEECRVARG